MWPPKKPTLESRPALPLLGKSSGGNDMPVPGTQSRKMTIWRPGVMCDALASLFHFMISPTEASYLAAILASVSPLFTSYRRLFRAEDASGTAGGEGL